MYLSVPVNFLSFEILVFLTSKAPLSSNLLLFSEEVNSTILVIEQLKFCAIHHSVKVYSYGDINESVGGCHIKKPMSRKKPVLEMVYI